MVHPHTNPDIDKKVRKSREDQRSPKLGVVEERRGRSQSTIAMKSSSRVSTAATGVNLSVLGQGYILPVSFPPNLPPQRSCLALSFTMCNQVRACVRACVLVLLLTALSFTVLYDLCKVYLSLMSSSAGFWQPSVIFQHHAASITAAAALRHQNPSQSAHTPTEEVKKRAPPSAVRSAGYSPASHQTVWSCRLVTRRRSPPSGSHGKKDCLPTQASESLLCWRGNVAGAD